MVFVGLALMAPLVMRPVTVVDVIGESGEVVRVHGWTQVNAGSRVALHSDKAPIRLVLRGRNIRARFTTEGVGATVRVKAVQRHAWVSVNRVQASASTVSLGSRSSWQGSWLEIGTAPWQSGR